MNPLLLDPLLEAGDKVIQLERGVYECRGMAGDTYIRGGTVLCGAGMGLTTIRLTDLVRDEFGGYNTCLFTGFNDFRNIVVSDLTIDCNYHGLGVKNATLQGIGLRGGDHLIERVRVINAAGSWARPLVNPECFVLSIFATPEARAAGRALTIRDCVVEEFQGGPCTAFCTSYVGNGDGHRPPLQGQGTICRIENCIARLNRRGGEFGLGMAGCRRGIISGNTIVGSNRGLNYESAVSEHLLVSRNAFLDQYNLGALLGGGTNSLFTENVIELIDGGVHKIALMVSGRNELFSGADGWLIARNLFVSKGSAPATTVSMLAPASRTKAWRMRDNEWIGKWTGVRKN